MVECTLDVQVQIRHCQPEQQSSRDTATEELFQISSFFLGLFNQSNNREGTLGVFVVYLTDDPGAAPALMQEWAPVGARADRRRF